MLIRSLSIVMGAGVMVSASGTAMTMAAVIGDTMGNTQAQTIHASLDGSSKSLSALLWNHTNPLTGELDRITAPDGSKLAIGDIGLGENPSDSDQSMFQRFLVTDQDASFKLTFLGGVAGYKNVVGYYNYSADLDAATVTPALHSLYTQHVDPVGTSVTFNISQGQAFGLYLSADAGRGSSKGVYYTENFRNSDVIAGDAAVTPDHFVMYQTNKGLLLAAEDIKYSKNTGLMGDQDFNDVLVGLLTFADGTPLVPVPNGFPVPEPASLGLLLTGLLLMSRKRVVR